MESLKRAAISRPRPPRGRGGAAVLRRQEASLTGAGGSNKVIDTDNDVVEHGCTGRRKQSFVFVTDGRA